MAEMKILIVDDEQQFSDDLANYLKVLGYNTYSTYTGEQALRILEKEQPHVLLCDLKLSGIGTLEGDDVLTSVKSISPKTIPIMLTAYTSESTQKLLTGKGAVKCLFKPIKLDELESLLKELKEKSF